MKYFHEWVCGTICAYNFLFLIQLPSFISLDSFKLKNHTRKNFRKNKSMLKSFLESKELNQCGNNFHCNAQKHEKFPFFPSSANYCRTFCSVLSGKSKNCAIFISCRRMKIISLCSQANYCSCLCAITSINMVKTFLWLTLIKRKENMIGSVVDKI